jgi:hypothetical protein
VIGTSQGGTRLTVGHCAEPSQARSCSVPIPRSLFESMLLSLACLLACLLSCFRAFVLSCFPASVALLTTYPRRRRTGSRWEDMQSYMFLFLLEYRGARADDRQAASEAHSQPFNEKCRSRWAWPVRSTLGQGLLWTLNITDTCTHGVLYNAFRSTYSSYYIFSTSVSTLDNYLCTHRSSCFAHWRRTVFCGAFGFSISGLT